MKKILLIASALLFSVGAYAQHEVGSLTVQPKLGLNIANFRNAENSDPRFGLAAGAEFEYQMTDMMSLAAGVLYSMQGATSDESFDLTMKTDYINIPIVLNVYVYENLAVKLGLQPGFNVNSSYKASSGNHSESGSLADLGVDIKSFDLAIPVGLSYEYNNIVFDARYNLGLLKLVEHGDTKNGCFQFTIGYKFGLK